MHDPTAEKNASAELTDVPNRCARGGARSARLSRSRPYIPAESATAAWISYLSSTNQRHRILGLRLPRLIRVIWTAKAEPPSGRAVEWNGKDVLGEYRAGGRALCRPLTLGLTPSHCPNGPAGERGKHGAKLASRSAYYQLFPRGRAWRTQHTLSLPASAAPAQVCTDSPAPCIREASACRAAAPSHAGLPRTRSDATGG
jgi:hypothetical protein